ncbi:MAG: lysine--tRNA ligase, partial [Candidatus Aenigmarchaeota archaeon]|nr:lysine--tRNA ligase [Candidatus Aenigmarchaeota archaeon]
MEELFWADQIAKKIISKYPDKKIYTIRAGLASSGVIHVGKFREVMTVHLVDKALKSMNVKTRFILYFDDYDPFRKVPKNVPSEWQKHLFKPLVDVPDPWGCHNSYSEHFITNFLEELKLVNINPEIHYESKNYRNLKYTEQIRTALSKRDEIRDILNKFRKEPLDPEWYPATVYCEKCGKNTTKIIEYYGEYIVKYRCECGYESYVDFSKKGILKLKWRVETPMKWMYYDILFEPWGKDHISPGGTLYTGREMAKTIFPCEVPEFVAYNQIKLKGQGVKMSSSLGNVLTIKDMLAIYLPEIFKFLYVGTKPNKEFNLPIDEDIIKTFDDFYTVEKIFFGKEKVSERNKKHWSRVYELSINNIPPHFPIQPNFRHCMELINIYRDPEVAVKSLNIKDDFDRQRYWYILGCAKNWMEKYGKQYMFELVEKPNIDLSDKEINIIEDFIDVLEKDITEQELIKSFSIIANKNNINIKDFFKLIYKV